MKRILTLTCSLLLTVVIYAQNNEELIKLYQQGEYSKVIEQAPPLIKKSPDDLNLKLLLGRAYADSRQYKEALPFLEEAKTMDKSNGWIKAWSLAYQGVCYFWLGDNEKSKDCLKQCLALNATKNVSNYAAQFVALLGFADIYNDFRIIEKEHIIFHFQPKSIEKIADLEKFMTRRELAFDSLSHFFKAKIPRKIDFFVWESREDAMKTLNSRIGFASSEMCIIHTHYDQTVGHELTHVVSHYVNNIQTKTRLINEGMAVYFDMTGRNKIQSAKEALQNGETVNIPEMWRNPSIPERYLYPIAGAFIEHLIQAGGKGKFLRLCINQTYENAEQIYSPNLDSIIQKFELKFADTPSLARRDSFGLKLEDTLRSAERDSIREKNIRIIDTSLDKVIPTWKSGKKPLIVINMEAYTYDDYQLQKHTLKVLTKALVSNITLLKDQSVEAMAQVFKHSTTDGVFFITIGEMIPDYPVRKEE